MEDPAAYGKFGLADLFELREECLREFQFTDAYKIIKQRLAWCTLIFLFYILSIFMLWMNVLSLRMDLLSREMTFFLYQGGSQTTCDCVIPNPYREAISGGVSSLKF